MSFYAPIFIASLLMISGAFLFAAPAEAARLIVILLGPPGSGKGTQAKQIAEMKNIPHISTGDIFREQIRNKTPLGMELKGIIESGKYVSDEIVSKVLFERLSKKDAEQGFLLDGYPRTLAQANTLQQKFLPNDRIVVLNLEVPDDVIVKRVSGRFSCKECGNVHNIYFSPPKAEEICDLCQGKLIRRADDEPEVVKERLRVYHEQTKPLVEFYRREGWLHQVDGNRDPEKVTSEIKELIK